MPTAATPAEPFPRAAARPSAAPAAWGSTALAAALTGCAAHRVELPHAALFPLPDAASSPARAAPQDEPQKEKTRPTPTEVNWWLPAVEIVSFEFLLNQFDRHLLPDPEDDAYESDWDSFETNLERSWVLDDDPFATNQLGHPYTGAIYHGFARSAGLGFWPALGYTFVGSALWETAGEVVPPSFNDQISTGIGGSFLGEILHRTANWLLATGGEDPGFARGLGAFAISPASSFNRHAFGGRFFDDTAGDAPAVFTSVGLGAHIVDDVDDEDRSSADEGTHLLGEFLFDYGLPGKKGYAYDQPFDQFHLEVRGLSESGNYVERLIARGLLVGSPYEEGEDLRGVWGLYGSYDYLSPGAFRVATTGLSLGTTIWARLSEDVVLQSDALAGMGLGAAGTVADAEQRDYHYGYVPQALIDLRLVAGETAMLQLVGRDYFLIAAPEGGFDGEENIAQFEAAITVRVFGGHALSVRYTDSERDSRFETDPDREQSMGSLSFVYSFLGGTRFGAVK